MCNKKIIIILFAVTVFMMSACNKDKVDETVNIDYEHNVPEAKPSPTQAPSEKGNDIELDIDSDSAAEPNIDPDIHPDDNAVKEDVTQNGSLAFEIDGMKFTSVNDMVKVIAGTANLRTGPATSYAKVTLSKAGDIFTRTAVGDGGWDQLQYQGETVYIWNEFIQKVETINKVDISGQAGWMLLAYAAGIFNI